MITEENKKEIIKIVTEELKEISILPIHLIKEKAEMIYGKIPEIYRLLENKKLLPENIDFKIFHDLLLHKLQQAAAHAHVSSMGFVI